MHDKIRLDPAGFRLRTTDTCSNTAAPNTRTSHPKSAFTIEEWETKAPLQNAETKSVAALKAANQETRFPTVVSVKVGLPYSFSTRCVALETIAFTRVSRFRISRQLLNGLNASNLVQVPCPSTPGSCLPDAAHAHGFHPKQSQTPQQFYDWLALIDAHRPFCGALPAAPLACVNICDWPVGRIDEVDAEVSSMLDKWRSVEEGGKNLQEASQKLLDERDQLVELQGAIGTTLEYLQELERASRLLNRSGESLVLQTDFLYMVERADICIEFLDAHARAMFSCSALLI
ncbi:hypothetical protein BC826DRAFT_1191286 [Russula brevipes]|nr:hypothetical protein BC826DRAFT_1191286 [Russula brevipes]